MDTSMLFRTVAFSSAILLAVLSLQTTISSEASFPEIIQAATITDDSPMTSVKTVATV